MLGVDAARGVALLGMMAVHIIAPVDSSGEVTWAFRLFAGRSSALFAVLAGVGLALLTRWTPSTSTRQRARDRVAVATRAVLLVALGLALGVPESGVAVILVYYGVLFVLAIPFLGLSAQALAWWAAGTAIVVPVLSHVLREVLPAPSYQVPTLDYFDQPWSSTLSELLLTGYYPAWPWMTYLLAGLAIGRLQLRSAGVAWGLVAGGVGLAVGSRMLSWLLLVPLGGLEVLTSQAPQVFGLPLRTALTTGLFGTTPTGTWWWLAVAAPHTATPLDLVGTTGSAMAVLGLFLLLLARPRWWATPLVAVGGMTLSLYTLHVVMLDGWLPRTTEYAYWWHVLVLTVLAVLWRRYVGQGPLEYLTQKTSRGVSNLVVPQQGSPSRP